MKILLPVDGSPCTQRMLSYVAAHPELVGPTHDLTFLTVVAPAPAQTVPGVERQLQERECREQAERVLGGVRAFAEQQHWTCRATHAVGHVAEEIARLAERESFDLIVMGSHGHTAYGNVLLGSVTTGVLARCKVPALIVR